MSARPFRWLSGFFDARELLAPVILIVVVIAVRWDSLNAISVNPDENQYEAHASYLIGTGLTTFQTPIGPVHANGLFKLFAKVLGPYCLPQVRQIVSVICLLVAVAIYALIRHTHSIAYALLGSALFVVYANYFEGLSANREWFAGTAVWAGLLLHVAASGASDRRSLAIQFIAGLIVGLAVWIKDQTLVLALAIVIDLAYVALIDHRIQRMAQKLYAYLTGIALAAVLYWLPFVPYGTARQHWNFLVNTRLEYASHHSTASLREIGRLLLEQLFFNLPFHGIWLIAYCEAALILYLLFRKVFKATASAQVPSLERRTVFYFLVALLAICLGSRFFPHYYLFVLPALSLLTVFGLHTLIGRGLQTQSIALALLISIGLVVDWAWFRTAPSQTNQSIISQSPSWTVAIWVILLAAQKWIGPAPSAAQTVPRLARLWCLAGAALVGAQLLLLGRDAVGRLSHPMSWGVSHRKDLPFQELVSFIREHEEPGDRVFVWGWRPEIYSLLRLEAATRFATGMEAMRDNDQHEVGEPQYDEAYTQMLIADLEERSPRFIVDAWVHSIHGARYRLRFNPPLRKFVEANYRLATTLDCCDIYVRNDCNSVAGTYRDEDSPRCETLLRDALARWPDDVMLRLNLADFLVQERRFSEASDVYRRVRQLNPAWSLVNDRIKSLNRLQAIQVD